MDGIISTLASTAILLGMGGLIGLARWKSVSPKWLGIAGLLIVLNDLALTRLYGYLPDLFTSSSWNWQGKLLALAVTLLVASTPAFGWTRTGLTLKQAPGSIRACLPVMLLYMAFFTGIALAFPSGPVSVDTIAFQLTMPGLEEESFYRGILLYALGRAFLGRWEWLGVRWHWGAIISCLAFGLAHAFGYSDGQFSFDLVTMALTAVPSVLGVWLVLRTRSILTAVILHNFGNAITLLI